MPHTLTTCTFCGVGCGLYLDTSGNQIVGVYPSRSHPTNNGRICVRGWHVHEITSSPARLKTPLLRRNGELGPATWDEALDFTASRLTEIRSQHGPDSLAFLNSPRCSNEEAYLLQKFARAVIGTNNVDHGTGVYSNNSIDVLLETIGVPATTNSVAELTHSEVVVVDGIDLARRLPTVAGIVIRAKLSGAKLIVIGTRRHRVADNADIFLQIRPGTEPFLYGAMAKVALDHGLLNWTFLRARCANVEEFLAAAGEYDLLQSAEICGVPAELLEAAALTYAQAQSAAILYSSGIESRTPDHLRSLVNLTLLTGNLGKAGSGIFALSEQNNLQGVCDMGMLPDRLPGYQSVVDRTARAAFEAKWRKELPSHPGLSARALLGDGENPKIHSLWLCRYDPVRTATFGSAAGKIRDCEFVVVQHIFLTEAAKNADVVLPTTAYGEEQVSFTNTERRIQLAEKVIEPAQGLVPAWQQIVEIANRLGADWSYSSSAEVMEEIASVVPFYGAARYRNLSDEYGRQWPCTPEKPLGTSYLFAEVNGERPFKFAPVAKPEVVHTPPEFPLTLVFGHSLYYWNQNVLIRHSETLKREYRILLLDYPEGFVEISAEDAKQFGIRNGEKIRLTAAKASTMSAARVTPEVPSGTVYVPYFVREVEECLLQAADEGRVQVRIEKVLDEKGVA